jgi:glycosyltransferase involved in cell wall biosynthesis
MNTPKVSVIVPVYNTGLYLSRCLDSVINQTLEKIEIICINDCSTDNSLQILQKYAKFDTRMQILNNERNFGETYSKNMGIKNSKGDYIGFVDSDDMVDTNFYEKLYIKAITTNAEITKANRVQIDNFENKTDEFINDKVRKNKFFFHYQHHTAIYSKNLLLRNNIDFPEGITNSGDIVFLTKAVCSSNVVETVDDVYYYYLRRSGSASYGKLGKKRYISMINSRKMIVDYINAINLLEADYLTIFSYNFNRLIFLPEIISLENHYHACRSIAACLMDLYVKCKYKDGFIASLKCYLSNKHYLSKCLITTNLDGLEEYLKKSRNEQVVDDLRENARTRSGII